MGTKNAYIRLADSCMSGYEYLTLRLFCRHISKRIADGERTRWLRVAVIIVIFLHNGPDRLRSCEILMLIVYNFPQMALMMMVIAI